MEKGFTAMGKSPLPEEQIPKIVPLFTAQEQNDAARLARYWDARQQGLAADAGDLEPALVPIVRLLEHYQEVTGPLSPVRATAEAPPLWRRSGHAAALTVVMIAVVLFASNTLLSPRSWLLSSAQDPDWVPWVSDNWLGRHAVTAERIVSAGWERLEMTEDLTLGA